MTLCTIVDLVISECDYPSGTNSFEDLKSKDHPIECTTCKLIVTKLENWLIDPTDEQTVSYSTHHYIKIDEYIQKSYELYDIISFNIFMFMNRLQTLWMPYARQSREVIYYQITFQKSVVTLCVLIGTILLSSLLKTISQQIYVMQ